MGENRIWDNADIAKGAMMKKLKYSGQWSVVRKTLVTVFLLFTVFTGCAQHQIIITKDPLKADEHVKLAQVYEAKGEAELAIKEYKQAIEQDKTNPMAYFGLGNISFKNGKFTDAEDYYKMAVKYAPADNRQSAMFYNNLSWVYIETNKDLLEAEKLAQKAALLDPGKNFIYLDTLGVVYTKLREYAKAEEALLTALKNAPNDKNALRHINAHLFDLYKLQGDEDKLRKVNEKLKELGK